jgi:hypothetical protein
MVTETEKDVVALKAGQATVVETLASITITNKETVKELQALRLSQWPPFLYVLTVAGIGATLMTVALTGLRFVNGAQIAEATKVLEYRVVKIEELLKENTKVTVQWKTSTEAK